MTEPKHASVSELEGSDDLDETMPMQSLRTLLQTDNPELADALLSDGSTEQPSADPLMQRLVDLSESIDRRLEQIAELLKKPATSRRMTARRKKKLTKKVAKKTASKTTAKTAEA